MEEIINNDKKTFLQLFSVSLVFSCYLIYLTYISIIFLYKGIHTQGTVESIAMIKSSDSTSNTTFKPIIVYVDNEGFPQKTTTSVSGNYDMYTIGEKVEIVYEKSTPSDVRVNTFTDQWLFKLIGGLMCLALLATSWYFFHRYNRRYWLFHNGRQIEAKYSGTEETSYTKNKRHYYKILATWKSDTNDNFYEFSSDGIPYDPDELISKDTLFKVYVNPNNLKEYVIDISNIKKPIIL